MKPIEVKARKRYTVILTTTAICEMWGNDDDIEELALDNGDWEILRANISASTQTLLTHKKHRG